MLMMSPAISQVISKGEVKSIVNDKGDTLIVMNLEDAKLILTDLLEYEITDSLLRVYIERDSLNSEKIFLKDEMIENLRMQNLNKDEIVDNLNNVITNQNEMLSLKDEIINTQKKEIKKQKNLKRLGFIGSIVLPIITLIILL